VTAGLVKKLMIKPGCRGAAWNAPPGYLDALELPAGATITDARGSDQLDFLQVFVSESADLDREMPAAIAAVRPDGLLWVSYRKGGRKAGTDLNRDIIWERLQPLGVVGVSMISLDDTWSAMRFRPADRVGT
jgi:hypothetical protein